MPELTSLHPLDPDVLAAYVAAVSGVGSGPALALADPAWSERVVETARAGYARAEAGQAAGANAVSFGLAQALATVHPTFLLAGAGPTLWEARIDRGFGMLLRPPSRLFADAGLARGVARAMPIRIDVRGGVMGGSYVPAHLVPDLRRLLDERSERLVRRLLEAELDGVAILGLLIDAAAYAGDRGLGLYEAIDVVRPEAPEADPPAARVIVPNRARLNPDLRRRLEAIATPPKPPGFVARLFGRRGRPSPTPPSGGAAS